VSEAHADNEHRITCPHCHKDFVAAPLGGSAARYHGFKCPHCKLFVPYERVTEPEPTSSL